MDERDDDHPATRPIPRPAALPRRGRASPEPAEARAVLSGPRRPELARLTSSSTDREHEREREPDCEHERDFRPERAGRTGGDQREPAEPFDPDLPPAALSGRDTRSRPARDARDEPESAAVIVPRRSARCPRPKASARSPSGEGLAADPRRPRNRGGGADAAALLRRPGRRLRARLPGFEEETSSSPEIEAADRDDCPSTLRFGPIEKSRRFESPRGDAADGPRSGREEENRGPATERAAATSPPRRRSAAIRPADEETERYRRRIANLRAATAGTRPRRANQENLPGSGRDPITGPENPATSPAGNGFAPGTRAWRRAVALGFRLARARPADSKQTSSHASSWHAEDESPGRPRQAGRCGRRPRRQTAQTTARPETRPRTRPSSKPLLPTRGRDYRPNSKSSAPEPGFGPSFPRRPAVRRLVDGKADEIDLDIEDLADDAEAEDIAIEDEEA